MSKRFIVLTICSLLSMNGFSAQTCVGDPFPGNLEELEKVTKEVDSCDKPDDSKFTSICYRVGQRDSGLLADLNEMSCVKPTDSSSDKQAKVQRLWTKYREYFGCDSSGFPVEYGNILKYSVHKNYYLFVDQVIDNYKLDINFKDPSDGKTLLDFVKDEVSRYGKIPGQNDKVKELDNLYKHLRTNLKAKHSNEV